MFITFLTNRLNHIPLAEENYVVPSDLKFVSVKQKILDSNYLISCIYKLLLQALWTLKGILWGKGDGRIVGRGVEGRIGGSLGMGGGVLVGRAGRVGLTHKRSKSQVTSYIEK